MKKDVNHMDNAQQAQTSSSNKPHYHVVIATPGKVMHAEYVNILSYA
jgi:hypothetical protein